MNLKFLGPLPKSVRKSVGVQTDFGNEESPKIQNEIESEDDKESLLAEVQSLNLETRQRRVQLDKMQSELLEKNTKISRVILIKSHFTYFKLNTQVTDLKHEVLHLGERARTLSKSKINDFVKGDVPKQSEHALLWQFDLIEDDELTLINSPLFGQASSLPNPPLFPKRGLSPWARGRAASAEDIALSVEGRNQIEAAKKVVPRKTKEESTPKWIMRSNRKSLEMEDATLVAELKRKIKQDMT
jgi:hypothetical protein